VLAESDGATKFGPMGEPYNPLRGAKVIEYARHVLDRTAPLAKGSHVDSTGYAVVNGALAVTLKDGRSVLLRPAASADATGIRDLFHGLSERDVFTRFFRKVRGLSDRDVQRLCNMNFETEVAFVACTGPREQAQIVAQACYFIDPSTNLAETAFMVHPGWQGSGLGSALQRRHAVDGHQHRVAGVVQRVVQHGQVVGDVVDDQHQPFRRAVGKIAAARALGKRNLGRQGRSTHRRMMMQPGSQSAADGCARARSAEAMMRSNWKRSASGRMAATQGWLPGHSASICSSTRCTPRG